jgi:GTPase
VHAQDLLFATLDPTLRSLTLPHGSRIILSDTVGFISDLPTMLVSAFRATLEEVLEADVILHVRDISHEDTEAQSGDVETILRELGIDPNDHRRLLEVWNKLDLLDADRAAAAQNSAHRRGANDRPIIVSALTGQGTAPLLSEIEERLAEGRPVFDVELDPADGQGLNWLYEHAEVLDRQDADAGDIRLTIRVAPGRAEQVRNRFSAARA